MCSASCVCMYSRVGRVIPLPELFPSKAYPALNKNWPPPSSTCFQLLIRINYPFHLDHYLWFEGTSVRKDLVLFQSNPLNSNIRVSPSETEAER